MNGLKRLTQKMAVPSICQLGQVDSSLCPFIESVLESELPLPVCFG